jgi:hypothetical protein
MRYKKRSDVKAVYVPGHGLIPDDRILEGDLDKFVPSILVVCTDEAPPVQESEAKPYDSVDVEFDTSDAPEASSLLPVPDPGTGVKEQAAAFLANRKKKR